MDTKRKLTVPMNEREWEKVQNAALCLGQSKSAVVRDFISNGQVVLSDTKMLVKQVALAQENFNNKALSIYDAIRNLKNATYELKDACEEQKLNGSSYVPIEKIVQEHEKVISDAASCFRAIRDQGEKEVEEIVNSQIGKR